MRNSVFRMVSSQWTRLPPPLQADLAGKTVVIVGANTGIGLEAAKHFARLKPARLIIGCRSEGRGRAAVEKIAKATGYAAEIQLIDLSNFASVQAFAARLQDTPVDILIANAAIGQPNFVTTKDGWEETLQVNHLSTALLCLLLLPNLARAAREHNSYSRLVVTSSGMHMTVNLDKHAAAPNVLRALNTPEDFTGKDFPQYSETKRAAQRLLRARTRRAPARQRHRSRGVLPRLLRERAPAPRPVAAAGGVQAPGAHPRAHRRAGRAPGRARRARPRRQGRRTRRVPARRVRRDERGGGAERLCHQQAGLGDAGAAVARDNRGPGGGVAGRTEDRERDVPVRDRHRSYCLGAPVYNVAHNHTRR